MQVQTLKDLSTVRPWRAIQGRKSRKVGVGDVEVGDAPITVQLEEAAADIVRVSRPDEDSAKAFKAAYVAGKPHHKMDNEQMVDHIVGLVEARAAGLAAVPPVTPARAQQAMEA
jgi:hypothetical protein